MATRDGRPWAVFGTMGGDGQPQLQTQVLVNLVDHGLDPAEALARPRVRVAAGGATITMEADYPGAASLARSDQQVQLMPPGHHSFGHAHAILIDGPATWRAAADPRSDGSVGVGA
jgi:gamma-glutamyltranspeptidase/glutathione hydrolase